jgi:hypothetical protein
MASAGRIPEKKIETDSNWLINQMCMMEFGASRWKHLDCCSKEGKPAGHEGPIVALHLRDSLNPQNPYRDREDARNHGRRFLPMNKSRRGE